MPQSMSVQEYSARVGEELGVSDWFLIDQERINRFADVTEDWQFVHVDPMKAAETQLGGTIGHGFLSLSLLSAMSVSALPPIAGTTMGLNYGFNQLRFVSSVPSGKRIRGRFKLKSMHERSPGQWQMTLDVTIEIEGQEKPAIVAEWLTLNWVS